MGITGAAKGSFPANSESRIVSRLHVELEALADLRNRIHGAIITPHDDAYSIAHQAWELNKEHYPALIIVAADTADVIETVRFAHAMHFAIATPATVQVISENYEAYVYIVTAKIKHITDDETVLRAWETAEEFFPELPVSHVA
jgi:hypothetical protein